MAPGVSAQRLQAMGEVLLHGDLQRIVIGPASIPFPADATKNVTGVLLVVWIVHALGSRVGHTVWVGQASCNARLSDRVAIIRSNQIVGM